jgi:Zn-dependent M28 family amino/carboxypeptidase
VTPRGTSRRTSHGTPHGFTALWAGCLALLAACTAHRVPPPSTDIDEAVVRNDLRVLASDDYEGRRPGTAGEDKTVSFLTAQFKKLGLKPGNGDSYVQQVPLVEITAGKDAKLSIAGPAGVQSLRYGKDMVIWTKREVPAVSLPQSDLVFAGYGIVAPEFNWNDYAAIDVRGKTVVVLVGDPGYGGRDPTVFKGGALSYYGRWAYKIAEAARHGAAAVLLIHDAGPLGYGWNVVVNTWSGPQLELASADGHASRAMLEGWLTGEAGRGLFTAAGLDYEGLAHAAARPGFKATPLRLKVAGEIANTIRRFDSSNVIAFLPGGERKHENVVYCAHWDGLGRDAAGAVIGGAEDNAVGVAGLVALAQSFSRTRPPPDRSIVFIAFTGEESGLLGSRYYAEHPVFPLEQTSGVINLDRLHIGGRTRDVMVFGAGNSELEESVRGVALLQGRELRPDNRPELGRYYDSDQLSFALRGVPALYVKAGVDDEARGPQWGEAQFADYLAHRYRQAGDKYSEDWDVRGAVEDLELYRAVGERLADSRRFPRWFPNSEFSGNRAHALPAD